MAISKAVKWISFPLPAAAPQIPATPAHVPQPALVPVRGANEKQFGLENFGNTCYANSVLQSLYFCSPFRDLVLQSLDASAIRNSPAPPPLASLPAPEHLRPAAQRSKSERSKAPADLAPSPSPEPAPPIPTRPPTLFSALRSLFLFISKNPQDKGVIAPTAFVQKLRDLNELFRSSMHQDAHEFLNYLLNQIVEEIQNDRNHRDGPLEPSHEDLSGSVGALSQAPTSSSNASHEPTLVQRLFEGVLTSETRCLTCETVTSREESFLDLSIDIEQNSSVTACLRQFSASEMLCQKNKFFCDGCGGLQEAEKRMKIKKLPNVLALHLKRFKYQEDTQKYIKLAYRVAFPLELRLFNTVDDAPDPDRLYELFAIVVHIGAGPHHGHYIAIIKGPRGWLVFDDDKIETIKESEISKYFGDSPAGSAYVLYYEAVNLDHAALGLRASVSLPTATASTDGLPAPTVSVSSDPSIPPGLGSREDLSVGVALTHDEPSSSSSSARASLPPTPLTQLSPHRSVPVLRVATTDVSLDAATTAVERGNGHAPRGLPPPHAGTVRSPKKRDSVGATRRPSTAPGPSAPVAGPVSPSATHAPAPPVPPVPHLHVNGLSPTAKSPERKPSWWKKRRSVRVEKEKEKGKEKERGQGHERDREREREKEKESTTESAGSIGAGSSSHTQSDAGSTWRRSSLRAAAKRLSGSHLTLDGDATDGGRDSHLAPPPQPLTPIPPTPAIANPHTPASATSAHPPSTPASTRVHAHDSSSLAPTLSRPVSRASSSSDAPLVPPRALNGAPPLPPSPSLRTHASFPVVPQPTLPPRSPARRGSAPGPPSPVRAVRPSTAGGAAPKRERERERAPPVPLSPATPDLDRHLRPHSMYDAPEPPPPLLASMPGAMVAAAVTATGAAFPGPGEAKDEKGSDKKGLRRAARKLSLTLGLGRDRRDKEREKRARPPSAYGGLAHA